MLTFWPTRNALDQRKAAFAVGDYQAAMRRVRKFAGSSDSSLAGLMIAPDVKRMRICNSIYIDSSLDNFRPVQPE